MLAEKKHKNIIHSLFSYHFATRIFFQNWPGFLAEVNPSLSVTCTFYVYIHKRHLLIQDNDASTSLRVFLTWLDVLKGLFPFNL